MPKKNKLAVKIVDSALPGVVIKPQLADVVVYAQGDGRIWINRSGKEFRLEGEGIEIKLGCSFVEKGMTAPQLKRWLKERMGHCEFDWMRSILIYFTITNIRTK